MTDFINAHRALDVEDRKLQADRQMVRAERFPVIMDVRGNNNLNRHKFAVPGEMTVMGLQAVLRKHCTTLLPQESLTPFVLVYKSENTPPEEVLVMVSDSLEGIYTRFASADKHLYLLWLQDNAFGGINM